MKSKLFRMITIGTMLLACLCFTAGCGSANEAEAPAEEDAAAAPAVADPLDAEFDIATAEDSPEFVGKLEQAKDAEQLFVVAGIGKTTAYVSMHQKDGRMRTATGNRSSQRRVISVKRAWARPRKGTR